MCTAPLTYSLLRNPSIKLKLQSFIKLQNFKTETQHTSNVMDSGGRSESLKVYILIQDILKEQVLLLYLAKLGVWCVG